MSVLTQKRNLKVEDAELSESEDDSLDNSEEDDDYLNGENNAKDSNDDEKEEEGSSENGGNSDGDDDVSEEEKDDSDTVKIKGNSGWADSLAKILKTKKPQGKKTLVLSKAKKFVQAEKKEASASFEVIGEDGESRKPTEGDPEKKEDEQEEPKAKKRRELHPDLRTKPDILDREREKLLSKIATRGVVQLFNAVKNQQKDLEKRIEKVGPTGRKKEKIIKSLDKNKFLDSLMGKSKSENVNKLLEAKKEVKKENVKDENSKWSVFRDDFMMGAKMKDWDKNQENDDGASDMDDDSGSD